MFASIPMILLIAAQPSPSITPQKAAKPILPKIDQNACPFEGCQFGKWIPTVAVQLYSSSKPDRKPIRMLRKHEGVEALTGIHITLQPSEIKVIAPIPAYGLKPGDIVFGYMDLGEGFLNAWFNGYWVEDFDGSGIEGMGCNRNCNATLVKTERAEWWVKVRTKDGVIGWTKDTDKFSGKDSLG